MPGFPRSFGDGPLPWRRLAAALGAAGILWICAASPAQALNLDVDTIGDSAGLTVCTAAAGDCSLRGAILRANAVPGPHTITLHTGPYTISLQNPGGIPNNTAQAGDLDILQNITINGVDPVTTVITWQESIPVENRDRVFHVLPSGNLTIRDVTIRQGGRGIAQFDEGGGILALGPLTLERASVRVNHQKDGGGIAIRNTAVIRNSAIHNNDAEYGSGLFIVAHTAFTVLIENSTISANGSTLIGGGVRVEGSNTGAIVTLNNVTVTANSALSGGGVVREGSPTVILRNTIVASNTVSSSNPNCQGTIISQGNNLVFGSVSTDTCGMVANGTETTDIVNSGNPNLGQLQDNGGPTNTHALNSGSPALDRGNPATPGSGGLACAATDQRGLTRSIDGDANGIARCDIGAAEGGRWYAVDTTADNNALQTCDANPNNGDCSLRGAISRANAVTTGVSAVITLPATGPGSPYRLTLSAAFDDTNATGDLDVIADITIVGGGATTTFIDGNGTDRVFHLIGNPSRALRLQDLTVQHGQAGSGGGIIAKGPGQIVSLLRVRVRENSATTGGGLILEGTSGGIFQSTISGNSASLAAGALINLGASVTIADTTISGNVSTIHSGGINVATAAATLNNVTISGNQASNHSAGIYNQGTVTARNTIIAGNTAPNSTNCGVGGGTYTSQGHNLVFGGDTCGFTQATDKQNGTFDPKLGPLQFNGGTTETMALLAGSAAIDAGNPAAPGGGGTSCSATDQRGTPRPIDGNGFNGANNPVCDIGAYEAALCTTRPRVTMGVAPGSPGRLSVTVTAGIGNIVELRMHPKPQDNIVYNVGAGDQSIDQVIPVNAPTRQFTIKRANGIGTGTLNFDVVDGCSVWKTLDGGGPNAWPAGSSGVNEPDAPESTTPTPPPACASQRPDVGMATVKTPGGQIRVTLTAQTSPGVPTNSLRTVRIASIINAAVTLDGKPVSASQTVTLPPGTREATLVVDPHAPGQQPGQGTGVNLVVTDVCGEWKTFVGSGSGG